MLAARGGHAKCTQMLIKAGSDVTAKDAWGQTAMDLIENPYLPKQEGHTAIVALLKEAMSQAYDSEACASATD